MATLQKNKKSKITFYSRLIICLFGLFILLYISVPSIIFYFFILKWNLNGIVLRIGFISGLVFLLSYFRHLYSKTSLLWIILNIIVLRILISIPFHYLNYFRINWDYAVEGRTIDLIFEVAFYVCSYVFPIAAIIALIISIIFGIAAIYRLRWIAGISLSILLILSSLAVPMVLFNYLQKPLFSDITLDRKINLIAKSSIIREEYRETPAIEMDAINARDLIVFPERKELFLCFAKTIMNYVKKADLYLNLDYNVIPIKYNILREIGEIKRAKLSRDRTKIYFANNFDGIFYVMDSRSKKILQRYSFKEKNIYLLRYREEEGKRIPEYIRLSDELDYSGYAPRQYQPVIDVIDFIVDEDNNELILIFDSKPIIQKFRMHPSTGRLEFLADYCFFSGGAEFGACCWRLLYDEKRDSYFIQIFNSKIDIFEIDRQSFRIKRTATVGEIEYTSFFYNPANRSILLSSYGRDILYEVSIDTLDIVDTHPIPRGIRNGYVDLKRNHFYLLNYLLGKFYIYDPVKKKIIHAYDIGRKPIALDVHPEIDRAYFVSSYGIMELDLK